MSSSSRMSVSLLALLVCVCWSEVRAVPVDNGDCQSPDVIKKAEEALDQINNDRVEGYIFGLNRVYDVTYQAGQIHKITIDVMEMTSHIISRKPFKQCEPRSIADVPVEGTCEVIFNREPLSYTCTIQPVSGRDILDTCPDCPSHNDPKYPQYAEAVELLLKRYNRESGLANYFSLLNITHGKMQWVNGPSYFIDFIIQETDCSNTAAEKEYKNCKPMDSQFAHEGFCKGSHRKSTMHIVSRDGDPTVDPHLFDSTKITCEIYKPKAAGTDLEHHNGSDRTLSTEDHNHQPLHPDGHLYSSTSPAQTPIVPGQSAPRRRPYLGVVVVQSPLQHKIPRDPPAARLCPGSRTYIVFHKHNEMKLEEDTFRRNREQGDKDASVKT